MQGMGPLRCCIGPISLSPKIHQQLQEVRGYIKQRALGAITRWDMNSGCKWKGLRLDVNTAVNGIGSYGHSRWGVFPFWGLVGLNITSAIKTNVMKWVLSDSMPVMLFVPKGEEVSMLGKY